MEIAMSEQFRPAKTLTGYNSSLSVVVPAIPIIGALALIAPLEHQCGLSLGMGSWHAWTVTVTVEGAAGACLLGGYLRTASLGLIGSSLMMGALHSARRARAISGRALPELTPDDWIMALSVTVLVLWALALAHALQHRLRAAAERTRADREHELAQAEQARAEHERRLARAEHERAAAERERARAEHELAQAEQARAEHEHLRADRERLRAAVCSEPLAWPAERIAGVAQVAQSRARALRAQWLREQAAAA